MFPAVRLNKTILNKTIKIRRDLKEGSEEGSLTFDHLPKSRRGSQSPSEGRVSFSELEEGPENTVQLPHSTNEETQIKRRQKKCVVTELEQTPAILLPIQCSKLCTVIYSLSQILSCCVAGVLLELLLFILQISASFQIHDLGHCNLDNPSH